MGFFRSGKIYLLSLSSEDGYWGKRSKGKKKNVCLRYLRTYPVVFFAPVTMGWTMLQNNVMMTYFFFKKKNRYDFCSNNEESFILDPDSSMGNRIESITQRTEVIEGKNKVLFVKISIGIFILKTHTHQTPSSVFVSTRSNSNAQTKIQRKERQCIHGGTP